MGALNLSVDELSFIETSLDQIIAENSNNSMTIKYMNLFKSYINDYHTKEIFSRPEIRAEVKYILEALKPTSKEMAKQISSAVKASCKSCVFHDENCMLNIFFILFKSHEIGKYIDFKELRPSMRMMF